MRWLLFCLIAIAGYAEELCFFHPPTGWERTSLTEPSPYVQAIYSKPQTTGFRPSINLSIEPTSASLDEYLKAVKQIFEQDPTKEWRKLGKMQTPAGRAQLTQIDTPSEWGDIRILQLILLKDGHAYILTASALKRDLALYYNDLQTALRSLTLTSDPLELLASLEQRESLKKKREDLLESIQPQIANASFEEIMKGPLFHALMQEMEACQKELGSYWTSLFLKQTEQQLKSRMDLPQ